MKEIYAVILAAGLSRRLGFNKLFVKIDGETIIRKSIAAFLSPRVTKVFVVVGNEIEIFKRKLEDLPVEIIHNPYFMNGMSASVKAVLPFLEGSEGVFFHLGDKPFVAQDIVERMMDVFEKGSYGIIMPRCGGVSGHPVLLRAGSYLEEMLKLQGDLGLREIIENHREDVLFIEGDEGITFDIDTIEQIAELKRRGYKIEES